jgi:hypothetical protein
LRTAPQSHSSLFPEKFVGHWEKLIFLKNYLLKQQKWRALFFAHAILFIEAQTDAGFLTYKPKKKTPAAVVMIPQIKSMFIP